MFVLKRDEDVEWVYAEGGPRGRGSVSAGQHVTSALDTG